MLFTVVESRDARLVAESADRSVKLTLEGQHDLTDPTMLQSGDQIEVRRYVEAAEGLFPVVAAVETAGTAVVDGVPQASEITNLADLRDAVEADERAEFARTGRVERPLVTTDLSDEGVIERPASPITVTLVDGDEEMADLPPLAEPAAEQ